MNTKTNKNNLSDILHGRVKATPFKAKGEHRKTIAVNQHVVRTSADDVAALRYNEITHIPSLDRFVVMAHHIQKVK